MAGTIKIVKQGITELDVDCIVNAANSGLKHGSGVCGAIFAEAGARQLQNACDQYGHCATGSAVITPGFNLKAKYIAHAVGPIWNGGTHGEPAQLYSCYQAAMKLAADNGCRTIAFPLISSGIYGYPREQAWEVAIRAISDYQKNTDVTLDVLIAVLDDTAFAMGSTVLSRTKPVLEFQFFWHEYDPYGVFSQWFKCSFVVEGIRYETAEQYMMAKKALLAGDLMRYALIMNEPDPAKCKKLGKQVKDLDVTAWNQCKEEIVYHANFAKFTQNAQAQQTLLGTGNKVLAEASPYDPIWGIGLESSDPDSTCPDRWKGQNLLGKVLMKVREEIRSTLNK